MTSPTPLFFYALYATPFFVAAFVLAVNKLCEWRASRTFETIEKPIVKAEEPVLDEVRPTAPNRHYISYATTY